MKDNASRDIRDVRPLMANWAVAVALIAICPLAGSAQPAPVTQPASVTNQTSARRGEELFTGRAHLRNRGPACISCHSIAGLPFPNGGTLGPNLTRAYKKLGPRGTQAAMQTLFFPVMTPIYGAHALVPEEQADLIAFIEQAETKPQSQWDTQIIILAAFLLSGFFVALTGFLWKDRMRSVRRALIYKATGQGARV